jgi:F-type H+-transporting ATPase subunit b
MLAFIFSLAFIFADSHGAGDGGFYAKYFNIPGFEAWKFLNLAIFVTILVYLLRKPLSEAFKAKREAIRADLIKAQQEKEAALAELTAVEARLVNLEAEKNNILRQAEAEAEAEKARILSQTEAEIEKLRTQTENEIRRLTQLKRLELRRYSAEESIRLAEEKIKTVMNSDTDSRLVKATIQSIGGLN